MSAEGVSPDLLASVRAGDRDGLSRLYERFADDVYRVALRLTGSSADAYDVAHDVFVGLPEALQRYSERASFDPWLRRVTARAALMHLRSQRRRREVTLTALQGMAVGSRPDPAVDRLSLERAIARLPDPLRAVYVLREVEGFSYEEVGEMLGIKRNAAEVRLHRARNRLRILLGADR